MTDADHSLRRSQKHHGCTYLPSLLFVREVLVVFWGNGVVLGLQLWQFVVGWWCGGPECKNSKRASRGRRMAGKKPMELDRILRTGFVVSPATWARRSHVSRVPPSPSPPVRCGCCVRAPMTCRKIEVSPLSGVSQRMRILCYFAVDRMETASISCTSR